MGRKHHKPRGRVIVLAAGIASAAVLVTITANWRVIYYALVPEARLLGAWQVDTDYLTLVHPVEFTPDVYFRRGDRFFCKSALLSPKPLGSIARPESHIAEYRVEGRSLVYWAGEQRGNRRTYRVLAKDAIEIGGIRYRRVPVPADAPR